MVHGYQGIGLGKANIERFYEEFWSVFPDARVALQEVVEQGAPQQFAMWSLERKTKPSWASFDGTDDPATRLWFPPFSRRKVR